MLDLASFSLMISLPSLIKNMVMTMLNQLFGLKNVKTGSELRSVGQRKRAHSTEGDHYAKDLRLETDDCWDTDFKDALRVPILAKAHNKYSGSSDASLPAFGHSAHTNKYQLSESNPYGVETANTTQAEQPAKFTLVPSVIFSDDSKVTTLGVYSRSVSYRQQIQNLLASYDLNIKVFGSADIETLMTKGADISVWVIDLSDEEDCPVLDLLLDKYGNVESLFLFESTPSSKCISKLKSFAQNIDLERIDYN